MSIEIPLTPMIYVRAQKKAIPWHDLSSCALAQMLLID